MASTAIEAECVSDNGDDHFAGDSAILFPVAVSADDLLEKEFRRRGSACEKHRPVTPYKEYSLCWWATYGVSFVSSSYIQSNTNSLVAEWTMHWLGMVECSRGIKEAA